VLRNRLQAMLARRNLQPTSGQSWLTQRGQREWQRLPLGETPSRIREDYAALLPMLDAGGISSPRASAAKATQMSASPRRTVRPARSVVGGHNWSPTEGN